MWSKRGTAGPGLELELVRVGVGSPVTAGLDLDASALELRAVADPADGDTADADTADGDTTDGDTADADGAGAAVRAGSEPPAVQPAVTSAAASATTAGNRRCLPSGRRPPPAELTPSRGDVASS